MYSLALKEKIQITIAFLIGIVLLFVPGQIVFDRGIANIEPIYLINVGIEIVGMAIGIVLYICTILKVQKNSPGQLYFLIILITSYFACFFDCLAWLVDGIVAFRWINIATNTCLFACAPIEACAFWLYTLTYLKLDNRFVRIAGRIVVLGLIIPIALRLINLFAGFYFFVDESAVYHRGNFYAISQVYILLTLISALVAVAVEHKKLKPYQVVVFFSYAVIPILVMAITTLAYGLSVSPVTVMLVVLLMYGVLNVDQGIEKAAVDRDLLIASRIQENVLPKTFPFLPERGEFELFASMTPAKEVGGDFYDFFMVDDDRIALVMADVSGKGVPAAMFMMVARTLIKNSAMQGKEPAEILGEVNNQLCEGNKAGLFVTVWLALISLSTGEGIASNAGHEHPALRRSGGEFELVKYKHSPALATMEDIPFRQHEFKLEKGDMLFVYTDGVTEAANSANVLFGDDRMLGSLNKDLSASPTQLLNNVSDGISAFVEEVEQFDDITMLAFEYSG